MTRLVPLLLVLALAACEVVKETVLLPVTVTEAVLGTNVRGSIEESIDRQQHPDKWAFRDAEKARSEEALAKFLADYPDSTYRERAEKLLVKVRAENRARLYKDLAAAVEAGDLTAARAALDAGASADAPEPAKGKKATEQAGLLHKAVLSGSQPMVALLTSRGADVNAPDLLGDTPLHLANHMGRGDIADTLRAAGADGDAINRSGLLPWEMAPLGEVEILLTKASGLIERKSGRWSDARTGRRLYDALKRRSTRHVVYGIVRAVAYDTEHRPETLL
ncbi:MAG: ankyrin repeat domain-containing protein, partial [Rhodobacterales bacterium]|nr:ankyrin repeat domain-containing protein [Rhodobacterales bacterium]